MSTKRGRTAILTKRIKDGGYTIENTGEASEGHFSLIATDKSGNKYFGFGCDALGATHNLVVSIWTRAIAPPPPTIDQMSLQIAGRSKEIKEMSCAEALEQIGGTNE